MDSSDREYSPRGMTFRRWYWYVVTATCLVVFAVGLVQIVAGLLSYSGAFGGRTVARGALWSTSVRTSVAFVLVGAPWWAFHWLKAAGKDTESSLRRVYLYLVAILGGFIGALVSVTVTAFQSLRFALGFRARPAGAYFEFLTWAVPVFVVGAGVWLYHWQRTREEAGTEATRSSSRRVYYYLLSGVGLGALAAGLAMLVGVVLNILFAAISSSCRVGSMPVGWWRDPVALFVVLTLFGGAIWAYHWAHTQRNAAHSGAPERAARSRRVYLYTFLCLSIVALVATAVNFVYQVLLWMFQGTALDTVMRNIKWSLQGAAVAVPVLVYHLKVLHGDRAAGSERTAQEKTVIVVVGEDSRHTIVPQLEAALGRHVRVLELSDNKEQPTPPPSEDELRRLVQDVLSFPDERVLVWAHGGNVRLFSYREET